MYKSFRSFFLEENQGKIKLSQRVVIFFFCLLISSFFWLLSALSKDYNDRLYIPLEYEGPSGSFVLTQDPPDKIMVEVRAPGFDLIGEQWSLNRNPLKIDLNRAKEAYTNNLYYIPTVELRTRLIRALGANLNLRYISPDTLYFKTEIRFRKKVPVAFQYQIDFASGYNLRAEPQLDPDSVWVSGPASFVDTIRKVRAQDLVKEQLKDSLTIEQELIPFENSGVNIDPKRVKILLPVEKFTEKELTLELKQLNRLNDKELRTFPDEVKVSFLVPLSKYEYLDTSVVKAEVELTEADLEKRKLDIELKGLPPFAKLLKMETEEVEFIVR